MCGNIRRESEQGGQDGPKDSSIWWGLTMVNISPFRESVCNLHLTLLLRVQILVLPYVPGAKATSPISFLVDRTVVAHTESGPPLLVQ